MSADHDFDEAGLTICAIHGTHFTSYVKFVRALGIPYSVITDGDPDLKNAPTGAERVAKLCHSLGVDASDAEAEGIFIGDVTLEVDLFNESDDNQRLMVEALKSRLKSAAAATVEEAWSGGTFEAIDLLRRVRGRKGLFAQRLAGLEGPLSAPGYIQKAFDHLHS